jgi:hypothetical protein
MVSIRDFLRQQGAEIAPWSSAKTAIDGLFAVLDSRGGDERFWRELKELVLNLDDDRFKPSSPGGAAIVSEGQVDLIIEQLEESMLRAGGADPNGATSAWLRASPPPGALLAFLLLGSSLGCSDPCVERAVEDGVEGDLYTYCELVALINDADIPWNIRINLLDCLPRLDESARYWLLEAFENAPDDELLETLVEISSSAKCDDDVDSVFDDDDSGH